MTRKRPEWIDWYLLLTTAVLLGAAVVIVIALARG